MHLYTPLEQHRRPARLRGVGLVGEARWRSVLHQYTAFPLLTPFIGARVRIPPNSHFN